VGGIRTVFHEKEREEGGGYLIRKKWSKNAFFIFNFKKVCFFYVKKSLFFFDHKKLRKNDPPRGGVKKGVLGGVKKRFLGGGSKKHEKMPYSGRIRPTLQARKGFLLIFPLGISRTGEWGNGCKNPGANSSLNPV